MKRSRWALILVSAGIALSLSAEAQEQRTWTSKDGSATLEARFHKVENDQIIVILPNGRSQALKREFLSEADVEWIDAFSKSKDQKAAVAGGASADAPIPKALKGNLVDAKGNEVSLGTDGTAIPKYYLFYYSASWCGPCVAFTPDLVRDYKRAKQQVPELEVILVPSDNSADAALAYLKDYRMPWPGLKFSEKGIPGIPGNPTQFIPALRLTDENGVDILTSKDVPRDRFLNEAVKKIRTSKAG
jgi:thiol-disulfide isomerase/thioredoxin